MSRRAILSFALTATILAGILATIAFAHFSGFCVGELRRVSKAEALEAVFRNLNGRYQSSGREGVPYESLAEYMSLFPGCCSVLAGGSFAGHPNLWDRIAGNVAYVVEFDFYKRWRGQDGKIVVDQISNIPPHFVTACGHAWRI